MQISTVSAAVVRNKLPAQKDPDNKPGLWQIVKGSIGKDISSITVPVLFNEPLSILQKQAQTFEYAELLNQAAEARDPFSRIALIGTFLMVQLSSIAEGFNKPFNPMLGETYELQTEKFNFIAEQVSHHPPITAWSCEAKDKSYRAWSQFETTTKFTGQYLCMNQKHPIILELINGEVYKLVPSTISAHNLILGTPYLDQGDKGTVTRIRDASGNEDGELQFIAEFFRRGWFNQALNTFRCRGEVYLCNQAQ